MVPKAILLRHSGATTRRENSAHQDEARRGDGAYLLCELEDCPVAEARDWLNCRNYRRANKNPVTCAAKVLELELYVAVLIFANEPHVGSVSCPLDRLLILARKST
jgi:hypothetical protein